MKGDLAANAIDIPIRVLVTDALRTDCKPAVAPTGSLLCKALWAGCDYDTDEIIEYAKKSDFGPMMPLKKLQNATPIIRRKLHKKCHFFHNVFSCLKRAWHSLSQPAV